MSKDGMTGAMDPPLTNLGPHPGQNAALEKRVEALECHSATGEEFDSLLATVEALYARTEALEAALAKLHEVNEAQLSRVTK